MILNGILKLSYLLKTKKHCGLSKVKELENTEIQNNMEKNWNVILGF